MKILNPLYDILVLRRLQKEAFYAAALTEFQSGQIRQGIMAQALAASGGDEAKARIVYIQLLAKAINDDSYLAARTREQKEKEDAAELGRQSHIEQYNKKYVPPISDQNGPMTWLLWIFIGSIIAFFFLFLIGVIGALSEAPVPVNTEPASNTAPATESNVPSAAPPTSKPSAIAPTSKAKATGSRGCIIKPVMTDADYYACGINPPR